MPNFRTFIFVLLVTFVFSSAAQAADGIGFAQAEEGTWYCRGDDPVTTMNCAQKKCRAKAGGQGCVRTKWCFIARWSGLMTVFLSDFHSTEIICGAPDKQALQTAFKAFCSGNRYAMNCTLSTMIDPSGKEHEITDAEFPGPKSQ